MSNVGKKLSGFKVGTKRVERGIMIGQFMIAFGEVIYDRFNKELRMSNPLFFMKDKEQIIYKLKEKRVALGKNMTLLFTFILIVGFLVTKRSAKFISYFYQKYTKLRQLKNLDQFFRLKKIKTDDFRCALCTENVRNVIFKPCLHLVVCSSCKEKLPDHKCPSCKHVVEDSVHIFVV